MILKKTFITLLGLTAFSLGAEAHSVAFEENFDNDYTANFPILLELDHQNPTSQIRTLFLDGSGVARPWWHLKDESSSSDCFLASHSCYTPAGTSNDWIGSRAIDIPSEGYTLTFGAQSASLSGNTKLSDLWVYITETPLSEDNLPAEPTLLLQEVPVGESEAVVEGDFTQYSLSLDDYAGKTIYINFANLNTDKDLLVIDNILVQRLDIAEVTVSAPRYVEAGEYTVDVSITSTDPKGLAEWSFDFIEEGIGGLTFEGDFSIAYGETITYPVTSHVGKDQTISYKVNLYADGSPAITAVGTVSGLAFTPWHSVLVEESTGLWCGNCPGAIYVMECMTSDEEMKEYVVPVSVHIPGSGNDMMVNEEYAYLFGVTSAPAFRFDRSSQVTYLSLEQDTSFDPSNPKSLAGKVKGLHEETALLEVSMEAAFTDPERNQIECTVNVRPALTLDCSDYAIGIVLTENNVGLDQNPFWIQTNYYSGLPYESELGGWTLLPEAVLNARYQDVARAVWGYHGLDDSMPKEIKCEDTHSFTYKIEVPDTYQETMNGGQTLVTSPAINPDYLTVIAYVFDRATSTVVNSARFPMTELTEQKFTTRDLVEQNGVETIDSDYTHTPVYYNMQGVRISNPSNGLYIVRRGNKTTKEFIR